MENFRRELAGLCVFDIKDDPLIKAFSGLGGKSCSKSIACYSGICGVLLRGNVTLAEYLRDLLLYSHAPVVEKCLKERTELRVKAIECDIRIIKSISEYSSETLKNALSDEYGGVDTSLLPDYDKGSFSLTANELLDFAREHGSGIFARYRAFSYSSGKLLPIARRDPIRLCDLKGYETQRNQVVENTLCFLEGKPAQNALLYGDRGTGKSSTVKAILNEYDALRMVELNKSDVSALPVLYGMLEEIPIKFIITIDDLAFPEGDERFGALKAALEGSLSARPDNILIYATTNRRKIIRESEAAREVGGADAIDESMSLADRFGLFVTFGRPTREVYLDIVEKLARTAGITLEEEELFAAAERFALRRGGRSPRTARQFTEWLTGRLALGLGY